MSIAIGWMCFRVAEGDLGGGAPCCFEGGGGYAAFTGWRPVRQAQGRPVLPRKGERPGQDTKVLPYGKRGTAMAGGAEIPQSLRSRGMTDGGGGGGLGARR